MAVDWVRAHGSCGAAPGHDHLQPPAGTAVAAASLGAGKTGCRAAAVAISPLSTSASPGSALQPVALGQRGTAHVGLDEHHREAARGRGGGQVPGDRRLALAAARRGDEHGAHGLVAPVAQVDLKHAKCLGDLGRQVLEAGVLLERAVARHGGHHGRVEGPGHVLGAVQAAVGLVAQQGERHAQHHSEQQAEQNRLQHVAALLGGQIGGLDYLRAARAGGDQRAQPLPVLPEPAAGGAVALLRRELGQLLLDAGQNAPRPGRGRRPRPAVSGSRVRRSPASSCARRRGVALGGDLDHLAVLRAAHEHVVLDVVGRHLDSDGRRGPARWPPPRAASPPARCCWRRGCRRRARLPGSRCR